MKKLKQSGYPEIKDIIGKLVRSGRFSELTDAEISILGVFAGAGKLDESEEKKTVLSWIWDSIIKYGDYADKISMVFDLDNLNSLFTGEHKSFRGIPSAATLCKLMTRGEIIAVIDKQLKFMEDDGFVKSDEILGSILLVGLAGIREFEDKLVSICTEKQGDDQLSSSFVLDRMVATAFISLVMMECEKADTIVNELVTLHEEYTTEALLFYYNLKPEKIGRKETKEFHEYLARYDKALNFPELTLRVFEKDLQLVNSLISANRYNKEVKYMWDVICPAIFRFNNKKLLREILDEGDSDKIFHILNYAILKEADWIAPVILKELEKDPESKTGLFGLDSSTGYIMAAARLSSGGCEWLGKWISDEDTDVKTAAILACVGKQQFREKILNLASDPDPLTNAAANFVLAASEPESGTLLESLAVELKLTGLSPDTMIILYCILRSYGLDVPAEFEDLWNMSGRPDYNEATAFYNRYPYRLMKWLEMHAQDRSVYLNHIAEREFYERCTEFLVKVADRKFTGKLKALLYKLNNEADLMITLSVLTDLEKNEPTVETSTLTKIICSPEDSPLEFEESELPYVIVFFHTSGYRRKEIIMGLNGSSATHEVLLRQTLEFGEGDHADAAFMTLGGRKNFSDTMMRVISDLQNNAGLERPDRISFASIITSGSPKSVDALLERFCQYNNGKENSSTEGKSISEDDIRMLLWLYGSENENIATRAMGCLASNHESIGWFKHSVRRWFALGRDKYENESRMSESALMAASVTKSEEFLSDFIKLMAEMDEDYFSQRNKGKVLDIISDILDAGSTSRYIMLRADDSEKVKKAYRLNIKQEFAIDRDEKMESLKLISMAFRKMADKKYVTEKAGMTVSINHEDGRMDQELMQKCLTREEFSKIAVYLSVNYTDESSGLIFAEVSDPRNHEPSGEIFNAILQSGNSAVFTVSWC